MTVYKYERLLPHIATSQHRRKKVACRAAWQSIHGNSGITGKELCRFAFSCLPCFAACSLASQWGSLVHRCQSGCLGWLDNPPLPGRLPDLLLHCHSFPLAYTFRTLVRLVVNQYASMGTVACRLQICFAVAIDLQLQAPCCEEPACRHSMPKLVMKYRNQSPWPQPKRGKARANMKRPAAAKSFKFVPYVRNQGVQKPFRKERERYGISVQYLIASRPPPPHPEVDQGWNVASLDWSNVSSLWHWDGWTLALLQGEGRLGPQARASPVQETHPTA